MNTVGAGQTVLDLGANVGFYTLLYARQVGPTGAVIAFEPGPQSFALLSRNLTINGYKNVTLVNRAVSDRSGTAKFFLCRTGESDNTLHDASTDLDKRDAIDVDVAAIDDYLGDIQVDLVKLDVQGSEFGAMRGMQKLIAKNQNIRIVMEFHPPSLTAAGVSLVEFLYYIRSLGLKIRILHEDREAEETTDEHLLSLLKERGPTAYVDLLLQRR